MIFVIRIITTFSTQETELNEKLFMYLKCISIMVIEQVQLTYEFIS